MVCNVLSLEYAHRPSITNWRPKVTPNNERKKLHKTFLKDTKTRQNFLQVFEKVAQAKVCPKYINPMRIELTYPWVEDGLLVPAPVSPSRLPPGDSQGKVR